MFDQLVELIQPNITKYKIYTKHFGISLSCCSWRISCISLLHDIFMICDEWKYPYPPRNEINLCRNSCIRKKLIGILTRRERSLHLAWRLFEQHKTISGNLETKPMWHIFSWRSLNIPIDDRLRDVYEGYKIWNCYNHH